MTHRTLCLAVLSAPPLPSVKSACGTFLLANPQGKGGHILTNLSCSSSVGCPSRSQGEGARADAALGSLKDTQEGKMSSLAQGFLPPALLLSPCASEPLHLRSSSRGPLSLAVKDGVNWFREAHSKLPLETSWRTEPPCRPLLLHLPPQLLAAVER